MTFEKREKSFFSSVLLVGLLNHAGMNGMLGKSDICMQDVLPRQTSMQHHLSPANSGYWRNDTV